MSDAPTPFRTFDIRRVLERAFRGVMSNLGVFVGLSLLTGVLLFVIAMVLIAVFGFAQYGRSAPTTGVALLLPILTMLLWVSGLAFMQAVVTTGVVAGAEGRRLSFAQGWAAGMRNFAPATAGLLLMVLAVCLGYVVLIVPGVILALMFCVTVQALVIERPGMLGAFTRSRDLTRGHRGMLFGLFLVVTVLNFVAVLTLGALANAFVRGGGAGVLLGVLFNLAFFQLFMLVNTAVPASVYVELRTLKDGAGHALASVFE